MAIIAGAAMALAAAAVGAVLVGRAMAALASIVARELGQIEWPSARCNAPAEPQQPPAWAQAALTWAEVVQQPMGGQAGALSAEVLGPRLLRLAMAAGTQLALQYAGA